MNCYDAKIVKVWRGALRELGALNGWELQHVGDICKEELVGNALHKVVPELARNYEVEIDVHVEEVKKLLEVNASDVRNFGIHGMAGIGKTTLAKIIYNQLKEHFAYHHFLTNIRKTSPHNRGLKELQSRPLLDIIRHNNPTEFQCASHDEGINVLRHVDKKVLIVVEDVDQGDQHNAFVLNNNIFAPGSRIITTSRKKEALDIYQVQGTYELNELQFSDALVLFYKHAFKSTPNPKFATLSREMVSQIGEFPLAIEVIGSFLQKVGEKGWEDMLNKLRKVPYDHVQSKLRIAFNGLNNGLQEAFLDIACFFIGTHRWIARCVCNDCNKSGDDYIEVLNHLSLVKVLDNKELCMHDQLRDLGREMSKRIRLWHSDEGRKILNAKQNAERIKAICLDKGTRSESRCFTGNQFISLPNLEFLQLNKATVAGDFNSLFSSLKYLRWHHCPNELFATNICLKELLVLEISESNITDNWNGWNFIRTSIKLKGLILKSCRRITKTLDFSTFPELRTLIFDDCTSLRYVDPSIRGLRRLQMLSMKGCSRLQILPPVEFFSLECSSELYLDGTSVRDMTNFQDLTMINHLSLKSCKSLRELPSFIGLFLSLYELDLSHTRIHALPDSLGELKWLKVLNMRASNIEYLPRTLGKLESLQVIDVSYCRNLNGEIILQPMRLYSLRDFIMDGTNITLPPSIIGLLRFRGLNWAGCYMPKGVNESDDNIL